MLLSGFGIILFKRHFPAIHVYFSFKEEDEVVKEQTICLKVNYNSIIWFCIHQSGIRFHHSDKVLKYIVFDEN